MKKIITGIIILIAGIVNLAMIIGDVKNSYEVKGVVTEKKLIEDTDEDTIYSFTITHNVDEVLEIEVSSYSAARYKKGAYIKLLFDKETSAFKSIQDIETLFNIPFLLLNIGISLLLIHIAIQYNDKIFAFIRKL